MGGRMSPEYHRAYYLAHREEQLAKEKRQRADRTPEQKAAEREYQRAYRQRNRERLLEYDKQRNEARWEALPASTRVEYQRRKKLAAESDPEAYKLKNRIQMSRRRAKERQATPGWAKADAIAAVFALARELEKQDGIPRHVDHIVPLRGKTVCGLHVEHNLQVLVAADNLRKKHWYDDWA